MARLDNYHSALLATSAGVSDDELGRILDLNGQPLVSFIVDYGLGPLWHERTNRDEFHASRLSAEALYLAQEQVLNEIDTCLSDAGIDYAVMKGAANRLLLYDNPALRACHDLDLLVRPDDRMRAASVLCESGFTAQPQAKNISREIVLSRGGIDIDLHWGLLREGRLRKDSTIDMLQRRRRLQNTWMLCAEDSLFLLLVHPAFAKHLAGWGMGLHRVVDIVAWVRTQECDWQRVQADLSQCGVRTAAWTTLRWVQLLTNTHAPDQLDQMMIDIQPGRLRRGWLNYWLQNDLSARMSDARWFRLLGFSMFLHDRPGDSIRAVAGRRRAHKRRESDMAVFKDLSRDP